MTSCCIRLKAVMNKTIRHRTPCAIFALIIAVAFLAAACSSPEKEKLAHVVKGNEYLKEKRYAEARLEFRSALKIDKKMPDAQFGLGEATLALGYVQEAADADY